MEGGGRDRGAEGPISRQAESQPRIVQSRVRPLWHNARSRGGACHVLLRHGFTLTLQLQPSSADPAARANNVNLLKFAPSSLSLFLSLSLVMLDAGRRTRSSNRTRVEFADTCPVFRILDPIGPAPVAFIFILDGVREPVAASGSASWFYGAVRIFLGTVALNATCRSNATHIPAI